ncbi:hypothetical protein ACWOCB_00690 [Gemella haemolysans]|uniref:DUF600 domain-containing protein n=1 Tax=Gemella haemolysans ATCC 10379 TaxID=546270 RepID=C5NXM6_9BACL|nr:hypothetical protein [Gemella haemolysans]EER67736.1 hypothetical protein GEMHA0001_0206 [Gemella haemolysans ATCC 10379]KAA8708806.1 hypothetical protein F4V11_02355 [Gemella haemolysans]MDU8069902.1 hypothetical protein [Gemella haemolysans]UBH82740.1 hypothetical protein LA340_01950 [Gemella haemolysans]VEI39000.1 Uncharacterised protein [Gemella haemolysans]
MNRVFEDQLMDIQSDMISLSLEYIENKAETVFIYVVLEDGLVSFDVFYKIGGFISEKSDVNKYLSEKINDSDDIQFSLLEYGIEDAEKIEVLFEENSKEVPTEIRLVYDVKNNSLKSNYRYDAMYEKNEDLSVSDVFEAWIQEEKSKLIT